MSGSVQRSRRGTALLEELVDVFLADGFSGVRLSELSNRLRCSKSTLYTLAPSKEQLIVTVVQRFFQRATERVEAMLRERESSHDAVRDYLVGISEQLAPASPAFFADLDAFAPAREIYRRNTAIAAQRVQDLVHGSMGAVEASFVGAVAGQVMEAIHRGEIEAATGLDDSAAYRALADMLVAGTAGEEERLGALGATPPRD